MEAVWRWAADRVRFRAVIKGVTAYRTLLAHGLLAINLVVRELDRRNLAIRGNDNDRGDVVVVAHSASGLFLPLVPGKCRVQRLVFLAAVIPQIGQSLLDQVNDDPQMLKPRVDWQRSHQRPANRFTFSLSRLFSGGERVGFEHNELDVCAASNGRNLSLERLAGRTLFLHPLPR